MRGPIEDRSAGNRAQLPEQSRTGLDNHHPQVATGTKIDEFQGLLTKLESRFAVLVPVPRHTPLNGDDIEWQPPEAVGLLGDQQNAQYLRLRCQKFHQFRDHLRRQSRWLELVVSTDDGPFPKRHQVGSAQLRFAVAYSRQLRGPLHTLIRLTQQGARSETKRCL